MEYERRQTILEGYHGGRVAGWVSPGLSEEQEAAIRERLIQSRFEHLDEYLTRIDEHLRELAKLGALDVRTVDAIHETFAAVTKLHPTRKGASSS
jgi:hypothetical protein